MRKMSALLAVSAAVLMLVVIAPLADNQEEVVKVVPNKEYDPSWMDIGSMLQKVPTVKDSSLQVIPLGHGKNTSVALSQLGPGTRVLGHIHKKHDEVAHIVMGSCKFKLGEDVIDFQP